MNEKSNKKAINKPLFYPVVIFSFLTLLFIFKTLPKTEPVKSTNSAFVNNKPVKTVPSPTTNPSNLEEKPGRYINRDLGFYFNYPEKAVVENCSDRPCVVIKDYSIRIEPLKIDISLSESVQALIDIDLFCNFQSVSVDVSCKNLYFKQYSTDSGVKGYTLYREKYVRTINEEAGEMKNATYKEKAYLLPIPRSDFKSVIIYQDLSVPENQEILQDIVKSYSLI